MLENDSQLSVGVTPIGLQKVKEDKWRLGSRGGFLLEGVIRRTHQGACFDVFESHLLAEPFELREFIRVNKSIDWQMFG